MNTNVNTILKWYCSNIEEFLKYLKYLLYVAF